MKKNCNMQNGKVTLRIMFALVTLLIIGVSIIFVLQKYQQNQQQYYRKALVNSEYGLMVALQKLHENPNWSKGIKKTSYDNGWYEVEVAKKVINDTLFLYIDSEGGVRNVHQVRTCVLALDVNGSDSVWVRYSMK